MAPPRILVFGGRGAVGSAVLDRFASLGWALTATSRSASHSHPGARSTWMVCDPAKDTFSPAIFDAAAPYAAVCWAQGANASDSVINVDATRHLDLYRANCLFVLQTLRALLDRDLLGAASRLVVVSSVWQQIARQDKLSYIMTKAAIGGMVRSASVDLAKRGIMINAVLPGALDTPMTKANLTTAQVGRMTNATGFDRLAVLADVVAAIEFLCSERNTGITGQSIPVDLGFSHARLV